MASGLGKASFLTWLLPLDPNLALGPEEIGGKAFGLLRLARASAPIPRTWVLPQAAEALSRVDLPRLRKELEADLEALPREIASFAVRSSASLEDSDDFSFAGLFESVLEVPQDQLLATIEACFEAVHSERVLAYCEGRGIDPSRLSMGLVVQEMVPAEFSGVGFRLHPNRGREEEVLFEVVEGLGEVLVSGEVDPFRGLFELAGSWIEESPGVVRPERIPALKKALAEDVVPEFLRICAAFERPLDIEFCLTSSGPVYLQARPITAVTAAGIEGEWTQADFNEGGVSSGVCVPYMWSLYDFIWRNTMPHYLGTIGLLQEPAHARVWGRTFYGVPYWNVGAVKDCMAEVPGFDEAHFDQDLGISKDYGEEGPRRTPVTPLRLVRALGVLARMYREFGRQFRISRKLLSESYALLAPFERDLAGLELSDFVELYRKLLFETFHRVESTYFLTIFNSSNAKLEFMRGLDSLNQGRDPAISYLGLMSGMQGLKTVESAHDLYRLARRFRAASGAREWFATQDLAGLEAGYRERNPGELPWDELDAYLEEYGHHSAKELDPTVPRWHEDPSFVLERLAQLVQDLDPAKSPEKIEDRQREIYREARAQARQALRFRPLRRWFFFKALARTRSYCWLREEVRDLSTRTYRHLRCFALEAGRRLQERNHLEDLGDVFYLPFVEHLRALRGILSKDEVRDRVQRRKEALDGFRLYQPPSELGARLRPPPPVASGDSHRGVGGAPGRVRGRVRVLRSLEESQAFQAGEILVAPYTDPGWTTLLGQVQGVVTEVGGVLSHAAVLAREYGVPAVLNVRGATRLFQDGDLVEVDGDQGLVRRIDP